MGPKSSQSGSSIGRSRDVAEIINAKCSAVIATREPFDGQRRGMALKGAIILREGPSPICYQPALHGHPTGSPGDDHCRAGRRLPLPWSHSLLRTTRVVASVSTASSVATYADAALARAGNNTSPAQSANVSQKTDRKSLFWPSGALARSLKPITIRIGCNRSIVGFPPQSSVGSIPPTDRKSNFPKQVPCRIHRCRNIYNTSVITLSQKITYAYQRAYWSFSRFAGARGGL